jgi:predicted RNA-binding Zn ribbon-like protein
MTGHESPGGSGTRPTQERSTSWWSVLVPAVALLIGLLIGGVVVGVADNGEDGASADPQPTESPTASATAGAQEGAATAVVVPQECLAAVETVEEVTERVRQSAAAIRDFRMAELRSLLRELESLDQQARDQVRACRDVRTEESPSPE